MKKLYMLSLLSLCALQAADLPLENKSALVLDILAPNEWGHMKLNRYEDRYSLSINNEERDLPAYMVSKPLRQMNPQQLAGFLQNNYLTLKQCSDGEFSLEEHGRLHGGGPGGGVAGWVGGYLAGQTIGYGVITLSGYVVLFGTQKVIGQVAGPAAEAEFEEKLNTRILPNLETVAVNVSRGTGGIGSIVFGLLGAGSPTP